MFLRSPGFCDDRGRSDQVKVKSAYVREGDEEMIVFETHAEKQRPSRPPVRPGGSGSFGKKTRSDAGIGKVVRPMPKEITGAGGGGGGDDDDDDGGSRLAGASRPVAQGMDQRPSSFTKKEPGIASLRSAAAWRGSEMSAEPVSRTWWLHFSAYGHSLHRNSSHGKRSL